MSVYVEKPKSMNFWKPLIAIIVIAGALLLWTLFAPRASTPLAFEILGFEGDTQIYDLHSRSWRAPKRGEEFSTAQELKTGTDGLVNFQVAGEIRMRLKENSLLKNEASRKIGDQEIFRLRLSNGILLGATTRQFDRKQRMQNAILEVLTRDYVAKIHGAIFRVQATGALNTVGVLRGFVEVSKPGLFFRNGGIRIRGLEETSVTGGVIQPAAKVSTEAWGAMKESYELLEKTASTEAEQIDLSKSSGNFFNYVFDHGTFYTPKAGYVNREFFKDPDSGQVFLETEYDVFPTGSVCGVYIKTRDFDIAKFSGLSFEVRRNLEEGVPDSFFIEFKSKGNVVRRFAPKTFERSWKTLEFDFHAKKTVMVNEVVFVFTNARVGEAKKGVLEFRNINLIPLSAAAPSALKSEATPAVMPAQSAAPSAPASKNAAPLAVASAQPVASVAPAKASSDASAVPTEVPLQ
jgi:hypothetical protein